MVFGLFSGLTEPTISPNPEKAFFAAREGRREFQVRRARSPRAGSGRVLRELDSKPRRIKTAGEDAPLAH